MNNAREYQSGVSTERRLFVNNRYSSIPLQINKETLNHGMIGSEGRLHRNAAIASVVGEVARNAIPVNQLLLDERDTEPGVVAKYLYIGLAEDADYYYPTAMVVKAFDEDLGEVVNLRQFEGIKKRYAYSLNAAVQQKSTASNGKAATGAQQGSGSDGMAANSTTSTASTVSIADMLNLVKEEFGDGLSEDVLARLGMERPTGQSPSGRTYIYKPQYSLPNDDALDAEIDAWRSANAAEMEQAAALDGESQFALRARASR